MKWRSYFNCVYFLFKMKVEENKCSDHLMRQLPALIIGVQYEYTLYAQVVKDIHKTSVHT